MENPLPLVSVIMPTYNTAKYIRQAIDSILGQTYTNLELVIVNDGGTDETPEIVRSYQDARIRYFELEQNRGRGFARNFAISKCAGVYIAIADADDISLPERLHKQAHFLVSNPDIDIVGTQLLHFADGKTPRQVYHYPQLPSEIHNWYERGLMAIAHASCMLKKSCFERQTYEDSIAYNVEDFELFLRLNQFYKMAGLPDALVLYRNDLAKLSVKQIRYHDLYHHYSIYLANAKLKGGAFLNFDAWSATYQKSAKHQLRSLLVYTKLKVRKTLGLVNG